MEAATKFGPEYIFSATYFNRSQGYVVDQINGTASDDMCKWIVFIERRNGNLQMSSQGVTNTKIGRGESLVMIYGDITEDTTTEETTTEETTTIETTTEETTMIVIN